LQYEVKLHSAESQLATKPLKYTIFCWLLKLLQKNST
jgi:hypothetical protein